MVTFSGYLIVEMSAFDHNTEEKRAMCAHSQKIARSILAATEATRAPMKR
jgi:hypothetical protein